ncbi:MAG TPA: isoprenylcysteine carboxylmethyltransferase family protein [Sphingobium sp.]|nr:isoprenylcysteine carboxylmethyltransferase family protein [Sphingobium sp.]
MMQLSGTIIVASWTLFLLVWALKYRGNKESILVQPRRERLAYSLPLLLGVIAMSALPARLWPPLGVLAIPLWPRSPASVGAGARLALLGLALALWARFTLGRDWSGLVTLKRDHRLVTSGPYAWIRHPIYTAMIALFGALMLAFGTGGAIIGWLLIIASCQVKLRQEEALMLGRFPEAYPAYMARTRRLLPFLL